MYQFSEIWLKFFLLFLDKNEDSIYWAAKAADEALHEYKKRWEDSQTAREILENDRWT